MTVNVDKVHGGKQGAAPQRPVLLAVDDEKLILNSLRRELKGEPYELLTANSGQDGLSVLARCAEQGRMPFVVISDYKMPLMDGIEFLEQVKALYPNLQRVLLTAYASTSLLESAINRGEVNHFLNKPWDRYELRSVLINACEQHQLVADNSRLQQETEAQNARLQEVNENLEEIVESRTHQLFDAKAELATTFDAIEDPVLLIDGDYVVRRANAALAEHARLKVTETRGRICHDLVTNSPTPCEGCPVPQARETRQTVKGRVSVMLRDTSFEVSAFPCAPEKRAEDLSASSAQRFVCTYRDITHEERNRRRMLQSQKLAALGEMAGAVAHEINNPLGGILAFTQIMMREVDREDEKYQFLECIEESAKRCQATVRNLLNYARFAPQEERQLITLPTAIQKAIKIFGHKLSLHRVQVEQEQDPAIEQVHIRVNSNEVQGVFLNLIHNAVDAMEPGGGTLTIKLFIDESAEPAVVVATVRDEGCGIPAENLQRIFDPFFTTKDEGKGTGLGLSISYQIIEDNGGTIGVESVVGEGTTFTLSFPIADDRRGE